MSESQPVQISITLNFAGMFAPDKVSWPVDSSSLGTLTVDCIRIVADSGVSYNRKGNRNKHKNNQQSILYLFCVCGLGWRVASLLMG